MATECPSSGFEVRRPKPIVARRLRTILPLLPILFLAACAQQGGYGPGGRVEIGADGWRRPTHYYPPPGPPGDPWGPYIREASARYRVPERWVRAVMKQESGGEQQATSSAGAMGLMQVMPATYEGLRVRYQLGDDPYDPHNNILAGTAYMREMYDRFGAPGFLAAYNAGPERVDRYLGGRANLPDETVNYLAAITPNLGTEVPLSGPFAVYASARSGRPQRFTPTVATLAAGCDLNAAYNPNHPCTSLARAAAEPAPTQTAAVPQLGTNGCDLNAAYDPSRPCTSLTQTAAVSPLTRESLVPRPSPAQPVSPASTAVLHQPTTPLPGQKPSPPAEPSGDWAIQVGAFATPGLARAVAEGARAQAPDQLRSATLALQPTAPFGNTVLYRARLAHLSAGAASSACAHLNQRQLPCIVVRPTSS
jgi:hypothetical protein